MEKNISILYQAIGKNIKNIRKKKKVGQEVLANLISLSRSSISNIEIGKHQPSIHTIYEIALALDCKVSELLPPMEQLDNSNYYIDPKFTKILDALPKDISFKSINILKELLKTERDENQKH